MDYVHKLQDILDLDFLAENNETFEKKGLGAMGIGGLLIGSVLGIHLTLAIIIGILIYMSDIIHLPLLVLRILLIWSVYVTLLAIFHALEFLMTALKQPKNLSYDSFIINHSEAYTMAFLFSLVEYWIESLFVGKIKTGFVAVKLIGIILIVSGQIVRSLAMWTCGEHFAHQIMTEKRKEHQLVTSGIYAFLRHPSYFGWFYWSIGTQVFLCNPICFLFYTYAAWRFFSNRIPYEESLLLQFYKDEYRNYCRRTIIGIPLIRSASLARSS